MSTTQKIGSQLVVGDVIINGYGERQQITALIPGRYGTRMIAHYRSLRYQLKSFWWVEPDSAYTVEQ